MVGIGPLLLIVLIAVIVVVVRAVRPSPGEAHPPSAEGRATGRPRGPRLDLAEELAGWVAAGLLSEEQSAAILAYETLAAPAPRPQRPPAARPRGAPIVAEALGYLGGTLASTGLVLLVARYWKDMATAGRLGLSGAGALGLLGAGALVQERAAPALARLRAFLWLASTALTALFMRVLVVDGFGSHAAETVVVACAGAVAFEGGWLWWGRDRPIQQLSFLGGAATCAGAAVAELTAGSWIGITVWLVGAAYLTLGLRRMIPQPTLVEAVGAAALVGGGIITANNWQAFGLPFVIATAFALLALATVPGWGPTRADQLTLGIVGGIALLQAAPSAMGYFSRDAGAATGLVTFAIGGLLLLVGARRLVRMATTVEVMGCATVIGGAALTGTEWHGFAPVFGIATAVGLVALGMLPRQVLLSVFGSVALLINVPWAILHFFPGEGRAPLLILVSGALILGIAVFLSLRGGWLHRDSSSSRHRRPPTSIGSGAI